MFDRRGTGVGSTVRGGAIAMLAWGSIVGSGFAGAAELRVFTTGAPAEAAKAIGADFAAQTGHRLTFTVAQPAVLQGKIAAGDKPDVIILPAPAIAVLNRAGALRSGSVTDLARVGIGVVVRSGSPPPDISNAAALRKLLAEARSIAHPDPRIGGGTAGSAIDRMIDQMGLTETVKPKLILEAAIGGGVKLVADGKAEVGLFNISEILPVKGVTLVGPLPAELQSYIAFAAAVLTGSTVAEPAAALIKSLAEPAHRRAWQDAGLEPPGP
jgi:molybdate transport system substrate-binding protein